MAENTKPNLNIMEEEFNTGQESAKDIPNAQPGEGIQGTDGYPGNSEQLGDVGNIGTEEETRRHEEEELGVDDSNDSRRTN
ncbi:MAG: hypothetical protein ACR2N3_12800 [Pyrinomonadaceae bacterium]